jgi:hypothetical protein
MSEQSVASVSRTNVSTMGESAAVVFNTAEGGETALRIPFEVIPEIQAALAHAQRSLVFRRQALGSGEVPSLFHVQSVRALDLPDGQMHLQLSTDSRIAFHFHVSRDMTRSLADALTAWLAQRA